MMFHRGSAPEVFVRDAGGNALRRERKELLPLASAQLIFSIGQRYFRSISRCDSDHTDNMALPSPAFSGMPFAFLGVERSVTGRIWRARLDARGEARATMMAQRHGVSELLARILAGRDVEVDAVQEFLDPTVRRLMPDPDTLTDMGMAAARIADAIGRRETIAIFGDYDVDGATSAAVLAKFLRHCGLEPLIHIPDRLFEGYGPNTEAVRALAEKGAQLLVTVDCGTNSIAPLVEAKALGL